jgi:hypothetical protein
MINVRALPFVLEHALKADNPHVRDLSANGVRRDMDCGTGLILNHSTD